MFDAICEIVKFLLARHEGFSVTIDAVKKPAQHTD